jgi:phospholipid/cholesterol/gamma-HCH transport system ATP-binding protein
MIRIINVHKAFGEKKVLQGVDLQIETGETMVVIGQSGSGKSVLLKHLIGLLKPDRGEIYLDGLNLTKLNEDDLQKATRKVGMLFQSAALFDSMNVYENIRFGLERQTGCPAEKVKALVEDSLAKVGLKGVERLMPHELSGGMKKRVGLARAIAYNPEVMLYDEPSTGIDPIRADAINGLINKMKEDLHVTSVIITHDMVSAYKVADRIAMLFQGRIIEQGTPDEIRRSRNPVVQQFITGRAEGPIKTF